MASLGQKLDKLEWTTRPGLNLSICSKMWMHNNWLCWRNWLASGKRLKKVAICMNIWDNLILASFCVFWAKSHFAHPWSHPSILEISHWLQNELLHKLDSKERHGKSFFPISAHPSAPSACVTLPTLFTHICKEWEKEQNGRESLEHIGCYLLLEIKKKEILNYFEWYDFNKNFSPFKKAFQDYSWTQRWPTDPTFNIINLNLRDT